jgi:Ca-activated chloride channel family protein
MGNYKDSTLEKLSGKGNGNYAYIDTLNEAKKVLVKEMGSTLVTIAKDVKIQVEFNPEVVEAYRLIGYENRMLKKEDFNNDKKDAGEIGAGHTITAFYEIIPKGVAMPNPTVDPLKYKKVKKVAKVSETINPEFKNELMTIKLRYKDPAGRKSKLLTFPLKNSNREYSSASDDFKFAASVAAFGMILRNSKYKGNATYKNILNLAENGLRNDKFGYRREFLNLIKQAKKIDKK